MSLDEGNITNIYRCSSSKTMKVIVIFVGIFVICVDSLQGNHHHHHLKPFRATCSLNKPTSSCLHSSSNNNNNNDPVTTVPGGSAQFEYQEMRANLRVIIEKDIESRDLPLAKKTEIIGYLNKIILSYDRSKLGTIGKQLPNTKWQLAFSTDPSVDDLPRGATVFIQFNDDDTDDDGKNEFKKLDYILKFSKRILGLDSITANCNYTFDSGPIQPGLLTFIYDTITTDMFGFKNLSVGLFGLLQGRVNYIGTSYFDGNYWIEYGVDNTGENGFYNVYVRVDDNDDNDENDRDWR